MLADLPPSEIIVLDDGSPEAFRATQRDINDYPHCCYMERIANKGRAATRNQLADVAQGEVLLFMDADAYPPHSSFLYDYLRAFTTDGVIYGGMRYPDEQPPIGHRLRHHYGQTHEQLSVSQRQAAPYARFNSICFLISKQLFQRVRFDETFTAYGHEDTRFGLQLQQAHIPLHHIDNPVLHLNDESDTDFLHKSRTACQALLAHQNLLSGSSKLLHTHLYLRKLHLIHPIALCFRLLRRSIEHRLANRPSPSLRLFHLYRLLYLCTLRAIP